MAYAPTQLRTLLGGLSGARFAIHFLDTADAINTGGSGALATSYISDGVARGLNVGDIVIVRKYADVTARTTAPTDVTVTFVSAMTSTAASLKAIL